MSNKSDTEVSIKEAYENAASLLESGEIDLAEYQLAEILKKFPDEPNALRLSGLSSLQKGNPEIALIPLKKALKVAPDFYQVYENLSQAWVLLGNLEEAEICLKKYLENNQSSFSAWKALGDILVDQGKEEESEKAYKNAISTDPKYIKLQEAMGLIQKGNLGEAEKIYREILAEDPENVDAIRLLALLASRAGSNDHAIRMLESCVKIAPDYALAWENLAKLYRQKDDQESLIKASKCFSKATELRPDWAEGWAGLGTMQTRSSQHDDGIESYQKSLSLKENQPRVHLSLGHVYKTTGSQDKSIDAYKDAIKFDEQFGEAYWSLANLKTYKFDKEELNNMELQIDNQDLPEREKIHFLFSLGKAYDCLLYTSPSPRDS